VRFVLLADGSLVVEGGPVRPADVGFLTASLELEPPYRVEAVRRSGATWAVGARKIDVVELPGSLACEQLELVWDGRERSSLVDGSPSFLWVAELADLAAGLESWVARARRLRGSLWEVELGPL
jgi:hypothetical protein